jgi:hypothetical protein
LTELKAYVEGLPTCGILAPNLEEDDVEDFKTFLAKKSNLLQGNFEKFKDRVLKALEMTEKDYEDFFRQINFSREDLKEMSEKK